MGDEGRSPILFTGRCMDKPQGLDPDKLPKHVAIIMDGNGRWAKGRSLSRTQGHIEGVRRAEEIVDVANEVGIKVLTLFTFSTENWNRPHSEVSSLMGIIVGALHKKVEKLVATNVQFRMLGSREGIPESVLETMNTVIEKTQKCDRMIMNMAFNYGSRSEMIAGIRNIAGDVKSGKLPLDQVTEETFSRYLYTRDLPDPDLLIRTSGERRISNFLLWQLSYSELYFTEKLWPEFGRDDFLEAIRDYQHRERRFGNLTGAMTSND